jgi:transposase
MMNQLKAQSHLWLDHTPGDLARTKALATLTARLDAAQVGSHVRHVIAEMISELTDVNQRIHDLDAMIKELVSPLALSLLAIAGISHNSAAVLLAEIGDITRFSSSAKLARYTGCAPSRSIRPTTNVIAPPRREPPPQQCSLHGRHRAETLQPGRPRTHRTPGAR